MTRKITISFIIVIGISIFFISRYNILSAIINTHKVGTAIDSFNGVKVYYNGRISNIEGRNVTKDGYNLGLKYQCVEFVKRYYYEHYNHKMPDSYGNAKDFFDINVSDGEVNMKRGLIQCNQPSINKPEVGDLLVFDGHNGNKYGHVAIISNVLDNQIEIIQQNPGVAGKSRDKYDIIFDDDKWKIKSERVLGWLRLIKS